MHDTVCADRPISAPTASLAPMNNGKESITSSWMASNQDFVFPSEADEQHRADRIKALKSYWDKASKGGLMSGNAWFHDKILPMYSEPGRYYHTLVHLEEMLGYLERSDYNSNTEDYQALVLTIFFHDLVYDPKSGTNEEDSASLFEAFCSDCEIDNELKVRVVRYILATKQHSATEDDSCAQFLLDIDMAVLGKEQEAYFQYASLIRREYSFVDHDVYCAKRAAVLKGFLENPIFGTRVVKDDFEEQARANLLAEIKYLKRGVIPGEGAS